MYTSEKGTGGPYGLYPASLASFLMNLSITPLFDRYFPDLNTSYVVIDNKEAAFRATNHLIENGYKKIGFITIDGQQNQMSNRVLGYTCAMEGNSLKPNVLKILYGKTRTSKAKELIGDFIANSELDALFFSTNYLTQTGLRILKEFAAEGKPRDLGIVTFDDNDMYQILTPTITVVAQPMEKIAEELMRIMLKDLLKSKKTSHSVVQVVLPAELIIRESSLTKKVDLGKSKSKKSIEKV